MCAGVCELVPARCLWFAVACLVFARCCCLLFVFDEWRLLKTDVDCFYCYKPLVWFVAVCGCLMLFVVCWSMLVPWLLLLVIVVHVFCLLAAVRCALLVVVRNRSVFAMVRSYLLLLVGKNVLLAIVCLLSLFVRCVLFAVG